MVIIISVVKINLPVYRTVVVEDESTGITKGSPVLNAFIHAINALSLCRVFFERLAKNVGSSNADSYLSSIFDTIKSALEYMTHDRDLSQIDWTGTEGQNIADRILQDSFEIFGG